MDKSKLILHFDARNTLFVSDFHSRLTMEKALNTYISGLVWGSVSEGKWNISSERMDRECSDKSLISYYKHMENNIVKCPSDRPLLREILGRFTQENGSKFQNIFIEHLNLLRWNYPVNADLTVQGNDGEYYHYILPTFFYTLYELHKKQRDFTIVIRTFGLDIPHILKAIKAFINGDYPLFPEGLDMKLCDFQNTLVMTENGYEYKYKNEDHGDILTTHNETEIINHWNLAKGVIAVKDDFQYWSENNYNYMASKPLWINFIKDDSGKIYHHIFFDDCIRPGEEDSIVHLRRRHDDAKNGHLTTESHIIKLDEIDEYSNVNIVPSDLLECIKDENYFLSKIEICESNFHKLNQEFLL